MKKILIIDDDKDLLQALSALLSNKGYQIRTVQDGRQADLATINFDPDVILLDVHLPHADGRVICQELKKNFKTGHIPILMISSDTELGEIMAICPADAFMAKPLSLASLYNKLECLTARA
jgi:DNA-binding response OmpR family regulator